jgi:hypothetical protein
MSSRLSAHKGLKRYRSKGRWYYYHRATRTRILAAPDTPEFDAEIAAAKKSANPSATKERPLRNVSMTLKHLLS